MVVFLREESTSIGTQDSCHKVYYLFNILSSKNIPGQHSFAKTKNSTLNNLSSLVEITSFCGQDGGTLDQELYS
jgi:hypothetical protein